jgi:hypothetical protein
MSDLKEAAKAYYDQGLNVVPMQLCYENPKENKKPLVQWSRWETERQTIEEFEALPFDRAQGFGVICGQRMLNGCYFAVIDVDTKKLSPDISELGKRLMKQFRIT